MRVRFLVRLTLTAVVVMFLSIASPAVVLMHAQPSQATLIGTVYDPLGAPVEGMLVYVESGPFGSGVSEETHTDKAGQYRFEKLPPGVYTISEAYP